jgi:hypothetical protein
MSHDELMGDARDAIEKLFGDTSVAPEQTRESLEELRHEIDGKLEAINADIDRAHEQRNKRP